MSKQILIEEMVQTGWCTSLWHKIRYLTFMERDQLNEDAININYFCSLCKKKRSGYVVLIVDNSNTDTNS